MSTDLEQFYEIFFEESSELLADMETCLLRLDVNSPDLEDLNAIFRAAPLVDLVQLQSFPYQVDY